MNKLQKGKFFLISSSTILVTMLAIGGYFLLKPQKEITIATVYPLQKSVLDQFIEEHYSKIDKNVKINTVAVFKSLEDVGEYRPFVDEIILGFLENEKVDLVYGFPNEYLEGLIDSGEIIKLDGFITESKFPIDQLSPAILNPLKQVGSNEIYALSPGYDDAALIYDKKIMGRLNISIPEEPSWNEILQITKEISKLDTSVQPITFNISPDSNLYQSYKMITSPIANPYIQNGKLNVNNETNIEHWKLFTQDPELISTEPFFNGNTSMGIVGSAALLSILNKEEAGEIDISNIGIKKLPVFNDDNIGLAFASNYMVIPKKSGNQKEAWDFIRYTHSKEFALLQINHGASPFNSSLVSFWDEEMKEVYKNKYGLDFTAFYENNGPLRDKPEINSQVEAFIDNLVSEQFIQVLQNKLSIQEAIETIEREAKKSIGGLQ